MIVVLSHVIAFLSLTVGSVYDIMTTEVPDWVSWAGIAAGLGLHGYLAFSMGSIEPLIWSLGAGLGFSAVGWAAYYFGMWGGADAFALGVLGFAAPYGFSGPGLGHILDLMINVMIAGFLYTLGFAVYKAFQNPEVFELTLEDFKENEAKYAAAILASGVFSAAVQTTIGLNGAVYFGALTFMILLYPFLRSLEGHVMSTEVHVSELEEGDVVEDESLDGRIKGVTAEEIDSLEKEYVTVRTGVRFVPVFPIALALTDLTGMGLFWIITLL